ncbi:MAG TPA: flagellar basal-body rod protein FlgC [Acidimicrobiales bacterium]|nr:flagellar basal-body rod protein FlgC [Acidimicrobiales bacterium]
MSGPFGAIDIARTGATMASRWMDVLGHNLSNVNTVTSTDSEAFRAKYLVVREDVAAGGSGVQLTDVVKAEGDAPLYYDPENPLADENGNVQGPVIDVAGQMADLIVATRHYQMNLQVVSAAEEAYQAALGIGR